MEDVLAIGVGVLAVFVVYGLFAALVIEIIRWLRRH